MAYVLLDGSSISDDAKRNIVIACGSECATKPFEHALRVNFHDLHDKERRSQGPDVRKGPNKHYANAVDEDDGGDTLESQGEDEEADFAEEEMSDAGASDDNEVFNVYSGFAEARKKLKEVQKSRGFFRAQGEISFEQRKVAIKKEKERTRCGACGRIGHWAGDADCPKSGKSGDEKVTRADPKKKDKLVRKSGAAGSASSGSYFVLDDEQWTDIVANQAPMETGFAVGEIEESSALGVSEIGSPAVRVSETDLDTVESMSVAPPATMETTYSHVKRTKSSSDNSKINGQPAYVHPTPRASADQFANWTADKMREHLQPVQRPRAHQRGEREGGQFAGAGEAEVSSVSRAMREPLPSTSTRSIPTPSALPCRNGAAHKVAGQHTLLGLQELRDLHAAQGHHRLKKPSLLPAPESDEKSGGPVFPDAGP